MASITNENIKHESTESKKKSSDDKDEMRWYVYRYRTFSNEIKKLSTFSDGDVKVFMPIVEENKASKAQNSKSNRPVLPGFFFVYASRNYLQKSEEFKRYPALKSYCDQPKHIFIKEEDMNAFLHIATVLAENPVLVYSEEFDPSAHNIAEFTEDGQDPTFAFIETLQGVNGGNLIVPIRQDELAGAIYLHKDLTDFKLRPHTLCYKIPAADTRFTVRHIAHGNKYDLDYINTANKRATIALQQYAKGEAIDPRTVDKLRECLQRYRHAETDNIKFQAKITLLLYKCTTILQHKEDSQHLKERMHTTILPAYRRYVDSVRKDKRPTTEKNLQRFLQTFEHTKAIEEATTAHCEDLRNDLISI